MFKRKKWSKILVTSLLAGALVLASTGSAAAQGYNKQEQSQKISDESKPWHGWPWMVGVLFAAGTIAVGFKNAKRTHLD